MIKVIKIEAEYHDALGRIEKLMNGDPAEGTPEANELEVLTLLVADFESKRFPASPPDPIEAIKFRMEQQNLTQRDMIPFIGSRSKVSEVLSGKRTLTLSMMRACIRTWAFLRKFFCRNAILRCLRKVRSIGIVFLSRK